MTAGSLRGTPLNELTSVVHPYRQMNGCAKTPQTHILTSKMTPKCAKTSFFAHLGEIPDQARDDGWCHCGPQSFVIAGPDPQSHPSARMKTYTDMIKAYVVVGKDSAKNLWYQIFAPSFDNLTSVVQITRRTRLEKRQSENAQREGERRFVFFPDSFLFFFNLR